MNQKIIAFLDLDIVWSMCIISVFNGHHADFVSFFAVEVNEIGLNVLILYIKKKQDSHSLAKTTRQVTIT
jgi:hypothetical protein